MKASQPTDVMIMLVIVNILMPCGSCSNLVAIFGVAIASQVPKVWWLDPAGRTAQTCCITIIVISHDCCMYRHKCCMCLLYNNNSNQS